MNDLRGRAASLLIGLATAIVIVALTIIPFLSPQWVAFDQGRAHAAEALRLVPVEPGRLDVLL